MSELHIFKDYNYSELTDIAFKILHKHDSEKYVTYDMKWKKKEKNFIHTFINLFNFDQDKFLEMLSKYPHFIYVVDQQEIDYIKKIIGDNKELIQQIKKFVDVSLLNRYRHVFLKQHLKLDEDNLNFIDNTIIFRITNFIIREIENAE